jgi:hypothetical protein
MLEELHERSEAVGLTMNPEKTKYMTNSEMAQVRSNGVSIQYCSEYTYLGQCVSMEGRGDREVKRRIVLAQGKFWSLKFILTDKAISPKLQLEVLQTCVIPTLLYGCQTWSLTRRQDKMIQICQRKMERKVLEIKMKDKIQNTELRRRSGMEDANSRAYLTKWHWGGHVARLDQERWTYATTVWDTRTGGRSIGRPRLRWAQEFKRVLGAHWTTTARDREKWKETINALKFQ